MWRKLLVGTLALVLVAVGVFAGYGWWTRRGTPRFSAGGAWGKPAPAEAGASGRDQTAGAETSSPTGEPVAGTAPSVTARPTPSRTSSPTPASSVPGTIATPKAGSYSYRATGEESVEFGPASACSWEVQRVDMVARHDASGIVMDWNISPNHQERTIFSYRPDGVYTTYMGMSLTCMGIRETSEDHFSPPLLRMRLPLRVGDSWSTTARSESRTETTQIRVVRMETVAVPAGQFETYVLAVHAEFTNGTTGSYTGTLWISPSLGFSVKENLHISAKQSGVALKSDLELQLASFPQ